MANQKLILTKDVDELGLAGDVVSVKPGYARNYLLPRRVAIVATPGALKVWEKGESKRKAHADVVLKEARAAAEKVEGKQFSFSRPAADNEGKIFGSVGKTDILKELRALGVDVPAKSIFLNQAIKQAGDTAVEVRLRPGVTATVKVKVVAEGTVEREVQEAAMPDAAAARRPRREEEAPEAAEAAEAAEAKAEEAAPASTEQTDEAAS